MNLYSCDNCGVVLDLDKFCFYDRITLDDGSIDEKKGAWNGSDYVPFEPCPVCSSNVYGEPL